MYRSFLFLSALVLCLSLNAQIPNGDFEAWSTSNGYDQPGAWNTWNGFTQPYGVFTCMEGTPGHTGASHLQLTTEVVPGLTILAGIAISGAVGGSADGFAYTQRPEELIGWWQYSSVDPGSDNALVTIEFTRWNQLTQLREQIGLGEATTSGNVPSWQLFSATITYSSMESPDTAIISFTSSGSGIPQPGSVLRVDDLAFSTSTEVPEQLAAFDRSIDPLFGDGARLFASEVIAELGVWGPDGRLLMAGISLAIGESVDLGGLAPGTYVVRARTAAGRSHCQRHVLR